MVRFDGMRDTRLPEESGEDWVEVELGVTWMVLGNRLREKGMGPTVYPTSAPRSTVGGWLAENGVGVGSYEYGWLLENVLSVEVVLAGGKRDYIEGEALRHFVGSRGSMGSLCGPGSRRGGQMGTYPWEQSSETRRTRNAVLDLYRGGVPLWHLGFLNAAMARAGSLEEGHVLIGAYPEERASLVEPAMQRASEFHRGHVVTHEDAYRIWEQRFFPAEPVGPGRSRLRPRFLQGARLPLTLVKLERKLAGVAIQGTVSRMGEVSLLASIRPRGARVLWTCLLPRTLSYCRRVGISRCPSSGTLTIEL